MNKEDIIRKLTSRKLWLAIALFVSGILTALGRQNTGEVVAGLIMQAAAVIAYIVGEGLVDSRRASEPEQAQSREITNAIGFEYTPEEEDANGDEYL